jgi:hypothetical protein
MMTRLTASRSPCCAATPRKPARKRPTRRRCLRSGAVGGLGALDQRAAFAPEQRDLMMLRGWSLYSLGHYEAANRVFMTVDRQLSSSDSKKALVAVENKLRPQSN